MSAMAAPALRQIGVLLDGEPAMLHVRSRLLLVTLSTIYRRAILVSKFKGELVGAISRCSLMAISAVQGMVDRYGQDVGGALDASVLRPGLVDKAGKYGKYDGYKPASRK